MFGVNTELTRTICLINPALCQTPQTFPQTNVKITTPEIQSGQTSFDKILSTFLSAYALRQGASYVPTTTQPQQQQIQYYPQNNNGYNLPEADNPNKLGLDEFITKNKGALLVVAVGLGLFLIKPPSRR